MAFFDYDGNGKKDWKDNARENQMLGVVLYYCVFYLCFV